MPCVVTNEKTWALLFLLNASKKKPKIKQEVLKWFITSRSFINMLSNVKYSILYFSVYQNMHNYTVTLEESWWFPIKPNHINMIIYIYLQQYTYCWILFSLWRSAIMLLGIFSNKSETYVSTNTCTLLFKVTLFIIAKTCYQ